MQRWQAREHFEHVRRVAHRRRALPNEAIGAGRALVRRRARHGHHLAALFPGHARRDQRAGPLGRLDNDCTPGEAGDDAVAAGKVLCPRLLAGGAFGNDQAFLGDLPVKPLMLRRVDMVDAAAEAGDEGEAGAAQLCRHVARDLGPSRRSMARADNGDGVRAGEGEIAEHSKQGRGRIERDEELREVRLAAGDEAGAKALGGGDLVFDGDDGGQLDPAAFANAVCDIGQGGKRRGRGAEALKQARECQWADTRCTDEADPIAALSVAERRQAHSSGLAFGVPKRGSVPFRRRPRLARCVQKTKRESSVRPVRINGLRSPIR
jgi:hypothetical protein